MRHSVLSVRRRVLATIEAGVDPSPLAASVLTQGIRPSLSNPGGKHGTLLDLLDGATRVDVDAGHRAALSSVML